MYVREFCSYFKVRPTHCILSDDNTWFPSTLTLNRRRILDSIQPKTSDEYQQEKSRVQDTYYQARKKWPHLSEYQEEFVIPFVTEHVPRTE